jgi:hypothetical protein
MTERNAMMSAARKYTDHPRELPAIKKTMSFEQAREAFWIAFIRVLVAPPTPGQLALLLAHSALETGNWQVGLWNWNFGNVKASESYAGYHQYFRCNERLKQPDGSFKYVWFDPPHAQTRFRAYLDAPAGGAAHLEFLAIDTTPHNGRPNVYEAAWAELMRVRPVSYVSELRKANYFTADEGPYRDAVVQLYNQFLPKCAEYAGPTSDIATEHSAMSDLDLQAIAKTLEDLAKRLRTK